MKKTVTILLAFCFLLSVGLSAMASNDPTPELERIQEAVNEVRILEGGIMPLADYCDIPDHLVVIKVMETHAYTAGTGECNIFETVYEECAQCYATVQQNPPRLIGSHIHG